MQTFHKSLLCTSMTGALEDVATQIAKLQAAPGRKQVVGVVSVEASDSSNPPD